MDRGGVSRPPNRAVPDLVIEILRFCLVALLAGVGERAVVLVEWWSDEPVSAGPFSGASVGLLLGAALGYVVGGALARWLARGVTHAERLFAERSAEQILGGMVGAVVAVVVASLLTWPVLFLATPLIAGSIFVFVVVLLGTVGYRVGLARRVGVLRLIGRVPSGDADNTVMVLDTSVAIDGRVLDVVRIGFVGGTLLVPQPVIDEMQGLADSADDARRGRGRRGLDTLKALRAEPGVDVEVIGDEAAAVAQVDAKLVRICLDRDVALLTIDGTLAKVAALAGCRVRNLHALAVALRPPVVVGDGVDVELVRAGKEAGQAVGYLDDGTMVVVERGRSRIGHHAHVTITSVLTTANGRMLFARLDEVPLPRSSGVPS